MGRRSGATLCPRSRAQRRAAARRDPRGDVAQLGERRVRIAEARGSSPLISTSPLRLASCHVLARPLRHAASRPSSSRERREPDRRSRASPSAYQRLAPGCISATTIRPRSSDRPLGRPSGPCSTRPATGLARRPEPAEWSVVECLGHWSTASSSSRSATAGSVGRGRARRSPATTRTCGSPGCHHQRGRSRRSLIDAVRRRPRRAEPRRCGRARSDAEAATGSAITASAVPRATDSRSG